MKDGQRVKDFRMKDKIHLGSCAYWVAEQPPAVRDVYFRFGGIVHILPLSLPFIVFVLEFFHGSFSRLLVFYRNAPLWSMNDTVLRSNLPNLKRGYWVCPDDEEEIMREIDSEKHEKVGVALTYFWYTPFSNHLIHNFHQSAALHPAFASFEDWKEISRREPNFVLRVNWQEWGPLNEVLKSIVEGRM